MAPSDSQHPEIGVREEGGEEEREEEVGRTKQNKHRGNFTLAGAKLGQTSHGGRDVRGGARQERQSDRNKRDSDKNLKQKAK